MDEPLVYIPTYKRDRLKSLEAMKDTKILERTALVVHPDEVSRYETHGVRIIPCPAQGELGAVRRWLMENHKGDVMIQMDDDLRFAVRRKADPKKFRLPDGPDEVAEMFERVFALLMEVPLVGIQQRGGALYAPVPMETRARQCMFHGLNMSTARENGWTYESSVFEDFDYTLQVLTSGYENVVLTTHTVDQSESQAPGGVAAYRDNDRMHRDALDLAMRFPDFVRIHSKKGWRGMEFRTDVRVQWKQAFASSGAEQVLDVGFYEDLWWS